MMIMHPQVLQLSPSHLSITSNPFVLSFHQVSEIGRHAYPYKWGYNADWTLDPAHPAEYWSGPSSTLKGTLVLVLNSESETRMRTVVGREVPELGSRSGNGGEGVGEVDPEDGDRMGFWVTDVWTAGEVRVGGVE
jgi:alpha-galactosidase